MSERATAGEPHPIDQGLRVSDERERGIQHSGGVERPSHRSKSVAALIDGTGTPSDRGRRSRDVRPRRGNGHGDPVGVVDEELEPGRQLEAGVASMAAGAGGRRRPAAAGPVVVDPSPGDAAPASNEGMATARSIAAPPTTTSDRLLIMSTPCPRWVMPSPGAAGTRWPSDGVIDGPATPRVPTASSARPSSRLSRWSRPRRVTTSPRTG